MIKTYRMKKEWYQPYVDYSCIVTDTKLKNRTVEFINQKVT
ncbi:hypothetical protein [Aquimarina sp. RZ0]|nr:hypothetical protein [Aquimarina sp. RZ0]